MLYMHDSISLLAEQAIYSQEGSAHDAVLRIQKAARSVIDKYKQKDIDDARAESLLMTGGKWKRLLKQMTDKGLMYVRND
jgi:hypothetical protein